MGVHKSTVAVVLIGLTVLLLLLLSTLDLYTGVVWNVPRHVHVQFRSILTAVCATWLLLVCFYPRVDVIVTQ